MTRSSDPLRGLRKAIYGFHIVTAVLLWLQTIVVGARAVTGTPWTDIVPAWVWLLGILPFSLWVLPRAPARRTLRRGASMVTMGVYFAVCALMLYLIPRADPLQIGIAVGMGAVTVALMGCAVNEWRPIPEPADADAG